MYINYFCPIYISCMSILFRVEVPCEPLITVLLNSVQEFTKIEVWLLLTFFLRLHNQLISIHFTVPY